MEIKYFQIEFTNLTVDIKEAALFFGVSVSTLRRLVKQGRIPFFKTGRKLMFFKDELITIAKQSTQLIVPLNTQREKEWPSLKRKIPPTGTRASQSLAIECKNRRDALRAQMRKNTKTKGREK